MNLASKPDSSISRRKFLRTGAAGAAAIASGAIWSLDATHAGAAVANGPSSIVFALDQDWFFGGKLDPHAAASQRPDSDFSKITLPHCVAKLSWQNWDPALWQDVWSYRRHLSLPREFEHRRVFVKFDGVLVNMAPTFNGRMLPQHSGGYLPFTYEVTQAIQPGGNVLDVTVDSRWLNVPPDGSPRGTHAVDYYEPGGIFRSVSLCVLPQVFLSDVFAKPVDVLQKTRRLDVLCTVDAAAVSAGRFAIEVELRDASHTVARTTKKIAITAAGKTEVALTLTRLGDIKLWDVDDPNLYTVVTTLLMDGKPLHDYHARIGFREASFTTDGFFLNGRKLQFFGLDRHEIYPYVGGAMPARVTRRDAEILRRDFNCNIVRCSHYPQSEAFLDACDELGLMAWEEPPGWQYIGDAPWQDNLIADVHDMIVRDRNHACIVIWGARVNESANDQALYRRTTALAKSLDDSRPTSGSMTNFRNWQQEWHEDVFAMDDYHSAPDGTVGIYPPLPGVPYMLAETVGQYSYGGKGFDNLYYRTGDLKLQSEQAIYHAQAHDRAAAFPRFCGVIAWCGFEYPSPQNSHNGVKNPGVADLFRVPKLGASFYLAQVSPSVRPVIAPNFYWDFGEASPNGPGAGASIFSNCDRLEIFVGGEHHATAHPDRMRYPQTKYPPFFVDLDMAATGDPELRIDGYVGDKLVLAKSLSSDKSQDRFVVMNDDAEIFGDGSDATRLVFHVVDKFGNIRLFAGGEVAFEISGPGILVGDNPFASDASGGVGAVWIKSVPNAAGVIAIKATHASMGSRTVSIKAVRDRGPRLA